MYFLSWIIVGLVAGWSAGKILKGDGYGPLMDIAIGIVGAVTGGFLSSGRANCSPANNRSPIPQNRSGSGKFGVFGMESFS